METTLALKMSDIFVKIIFILLVKWFPSLYSRGFDQIFINSLYSYNQIVSFIAS